MRHADTIKLTDAEKAALEKGQKYGKSPRFRRRCHGILLKSTGKTNKEVGEILGCSHVSVYLWQQAFEEGGIKALEIKSVQRHKPILNKEEHEKAVRKAVSENRESLKAAKAAFEKDTGVSLSRTTLRRFLEALAQDISV
ncbi:MAG: helix-turn-helix domain-containing protein [Bacteroidales bacterium]|nr:helix-turn-helix domain-containing protein [Bacteroidales bacterium]